MAKVQLLTAATSAAAPTAANDGKSLAEFGHVDETALVVWNTAGTGTVSVTLKLWLYTAVSGRWAPAGIAQVASEKGLINGGFALNETGADVVDHTEVIQNLRHYDRAALEIVAITGTGTAISAVLTAQSRGWR